MRFHELGPYAGDSAYCRRCRQWLNNDLQELGCAGELLIELPLQVARDRKYERGALQHRQGRPDFVGDPLLELFDEMLDAVTYVDELAKRGIDMSHRRANLVSTALECQEIWRRASGKRME